MGKNCVERRPCCGEIANFNRRMMSCVMSESGVSPKSRRSALVTLWCGYFPFCLCRISNYECNSIAMCARGVFITGGCFWATGGWGTLAEKCGIDTHIKANGKTGSNPKRGINDMMIK